MEWKGRKVLALAVCLGLNIVQTYAAPAPEVPVYRSFKDWEVGCDNTRRCTAIGLQPEDYAAVTAFLRVERAADGLAPPVVRILLAKEGLAPGDPVTLTMDGGPIQGVPSQRTIDSLESEVAYPSIRLAANETTPFSMPCGRASACNSPSTMPHARKFHWMARWRRCCSSMTCRGDWIQ